jgi:hypothetical protein
MGKISVFFGSLGDEDNSGYDASYADSRADYAAASRKGITPDSIKIPHMIALLIAGRQIGRNRGSRKRRKRTATTA